MSQESNKKTPALIAQATGLPLDVARFIAAIEAGEIEGDCIELAEPIPGRQESERAEP